MEFMEYCERASAWCFICEMVGAWKDEFFGTYY
jgi:hypothetical protein